MKKYRRGSKIVDIVKRTFKYRDKSAENIVQIPFHQHTSTSEVTHHARVCKRAIEGPVPNLEQCTSNQQYVHDQNVSMESARQDVSYDILLIENAASILPSTSAPTTKTNYGGSQDEIFESSLGRDSSSMTLLNDDLYLTDSSYEYIPDVDDTTTSSSEFSDNLSKPSTSRRVLTVTKNRNNKNNSERFHVNPVSHNREHLERNLPPDSTNRACVRSVISGQKGRNPKRRPAVPSQWKKNIRKNKRQHGEPYLSAKGVLIPGKTLKESECMGQCMHQCTSKFSEEERLKIFSSFWNISNVEQKRLYIVSLIHREKTKTFHSKQSKKKLTNKYFLRKSDTTEKIRVCLKFFVATLNVSETFIRFCFKKVINTNIVIEDKRGKHAPHNKKSIEVREHVKNHIKSFPRMPPPRVRRDTKKEYLGRNLNLTKMYKLYQIKCDSEQRESVELAYYRSVFKKDFNIGFHRPGRDVCDTCLTFEQLNEEEKENEKENLEEHLTRINIARQHREEAKRLAQSGEMHFAEYDLKTICDDPSSSFRRTLPAYNFMLQDFNKNNCNVFSYCWHEGIARKGAAEIGSCLYKYLQNNADGKPVTFMSDTCASQCRNMYISSLLLYCSEIFDIPEINQKYFEQNHTQLETDNIHATIEKAKKNIAINRPSDFYDVIRKSVGEYRNNVYEMNTDDFIDIKYLKNILVKNAKVDCQGQPVNWLNIRWLQYRKENPGHIYFKYDLSDTEFNKIEVIRRGKRLQNCKEIILLKKPYY